MLPNKQAPDHSSPSSLHTEQAPPRGKPVAQLLFTSLPWHPQGTGSTSPAVSCSLLACSDSYPQPHFQPSTRRVHTHTLSKGMIPHALLRGQDTGPIALAPSESRTSKIKMLTPPMDSSQVANNEHRHGEFQRAARETPCDPNGGTSQTSEPTQTGGGTLPEAALIPGRCLLPVLPGTV